MSLLDKFVLAVIILVVGYIMIPLFLKMCAFALSAGIQEGINEYRRKKDAETERQSSKTKYDA